MILKNHFSLTVVFVNPAVAKRFPGLLKVLLLSGMGFRSVVCETG
jgi:hypothetical protein